MSRPTRVGIFIILLGILLTLMGYVFEEYGGRYSRGAFPVSLLLSFILPDDEVADLKVEGFFLPGVHCGSDYR